MHPPAPTPTPTSTPTPPLFCADGFVRLYRFLDEGRRIELVHATAVEGVPGAMAAFKGRLLVGVDSNLRLYDMGESACVPAGEQEQPTVVGLVGCDGVRCGRCTEHWIPPPLLFLPLLSSSRRPTAVKPQAFPHPHSCTRPVPPTATHLLAHLPALPPYPHPPAAGKKRLLRKCEYRRLPTRVATLNVAGSRVYIGDGQESLYYMRWGASCGLGKGRRKGRSVIWRCRRGRGSTLRGGCGGFFQGA